MHPACEKNDISIFLQEQFNIQIRVENFLTYFTDFQKENSCPKISKIRKLPLLPTTCIGILVVRGGTQCSEQTGRKLLFTRERNLSSNFLM